MRHSLLLICVCVLLSACEDNSTKRKAPVSTGYAAYIQVHLNENDDKALVGASFYRDSRKIMLVAGDMVVVENGSHSAALKGQRNNMGFYSAWLDIDNPADGVSFTIDYLPIVAREDRWYPADIAYVDNGPGQYVGKLSGTIEFPPQITIVAPSPGEQYTDKADLLTISWANDPDVEQVRIEAFLGCVGQTVSLLVKDNSGGAGDTYSIVIDDIFKLLPYVVTLPLDKLILDIMHIATLGLIPVDKPKQITECAIDIYVLAEKHQDLGGIFASGSTVVASQSSSVRIHFSNLGAPLIIW